MSWHLGRMASFDVESTGVDVETARIVTASLTMVGGGQPTEATAWLADPGIEIPTEASDIHGITTERARAEGRPAREVVEEIAYLLADALQQRIPIVAMNARYDLTVLDRECRRHGLPTVTERTGGLTGPVIDPYVIDKQVDKYRKGSRKLTALCEHYGVQLGDDAHEAGADALAAARVAYKLAIRFPKLQVDLPQLFVWQQKWAAEQAASLQAYFRRKDPKAVVEGAWPLVPAQTRGEG
ncbi:3'-5' exonuclease [Peterkaempfera sp. SMS 1(5)a]|uniref:3'-5' exonuclease n=1 Tax=Peterkaempfera podocarpi TaxID=3232308 RepID=UPI00366BEC65